MAPELDRSTDSHDPSVRECVAATGECWEARANDLPWPEEFEPDRKRLGQPESENAFGDAALGVLKEATLLAAGASSTGAQAAILRLPCSVGIERLFSESVDYTQGRGLDERWLPARLALLFELRVAQDPEPNRGSC